MQRGRPDLVEPGGHGNAALPALLPTPTAAANGSNRSMSAGAVRRPGLAQLVREHLLPTPTAGGTGYMSGTHRDTWRPSLESAVRGFQPTRGGRPDQSTAALLPTPTVADSRSSANATAGRSTPLVGHAGRTLTDAARLLPTPMTVNTTSQRAKTARPTRGPSRGGPSYGLQDVVGLLPTPRASDGTKGCPGQRGSRGDLTLPAAAVRVLPTPTTSDGRGPGGHGSGGPDLRTTVADLPAGATDWLGDVDESRWGAYAAAVARWQVLLGRPVPEPTQPGRHGKPVLAPGFVEWLMGLDEGWVTDLGLPRTLALRVLGNGVVPRQAAAALRLLLCPHRWEINRHGGQP